MPSKKLNARKGQILFLLSGICSQIDSLTNLIDCYVSNQARSENTQEHLTPSQVFFLRRLSSSLRTIRKVLTSRIKKYRFDSGLITGSNNSE